MKTTEELNSLKEELETLNKKLEELTEEELTHVSGGVYSSKFVNEYTKDEYIGCGFEPVCPEDYEFGHQYG